MKMCTEHHYWHHDYVRLAFDSGFCFDSNKSKTNLDRSILSIIDIETVVKDRDVGVIEKHLNTIINYYLEPEHTKILDPTFVKVFRLSQLSVEYLQFCKRYLDNTVVVVKKELAQYKEENNHLKNYTEELKSEINELKERINLLKESLEKQKVTLENNQGFKCPTCLKVFVTEEYLLSHIKRRHETVSFQLETDKLQLEIKELKERLNTTEKYIKSDNNLKITEKLENIPDNNQPVVNEKLERVDLLLTKFEELKQFVEKELSLLKAENNNDKYERWLETVFKRLDSSKKELQSERYGDGDTFSTGDKTECQKIDNVTQTGIIEYKDSEVMTEEIECKIEDSNKQQISEIETEIKKLQEELYINTENHLGLIQNALEKKLTGGLELIQTQINTFYEKINKFEFEKRAEIKEENEAPLKCEKSDQIIQVGIEPRPLPRTTKSLPFIKEKKVLTNKRSAPKLENKPFVKNVTCGLNSQVSSFSSISDDEKVLLPKSIKENINFKPKLVSEKKEIKKNLEVKTLYDKNIKVGTMFCDSNDTEEEEIVEKIPGKPSNSTLGRRSISSLKQVGKDKQVLEGLKKELEEMLCLRLKGVGVSPTWKRLPKNSYIKAMKIVQHQMELTTKKYPDYYKIREKLLKQINKTKIKQKSFVTSPKEIFETKTGKKKVLFDLEGKDKLKDKSKLKEQDKLTERDKIQTLTKVKSKKDENVRDKIQILNDDSDATSVSITSSILDAPKPQSSQNKDEKDRRFHESDKIEISDWEISDIS
nr:zinc finger protein DZIP1L [Onthophagus taurus]